MGWRLTPWGYEVEGGFPPGPLIDVEYFHEFSRHTYANDEGIERAVEQCSAAIRSRCGWHVAPDLRCRATLDGGRPTLWLPANQVLEVESVEVLGEPVDDFQWSRLGQLRLPTPPDVLGAVVVTYRAGLPDVPEDLAGLVAHRVMHAVATPFGVTQETAGSVSISYSQSAANDAGGVTLTARDVDLLAPYRLVEAT